MRFVNLLNANGAAFADIQTTELVTVKALCIVMYSLSQTLGIAFRYASDCDTK